jgi:hypothetical protein
VTGAPKPHEKYAKRRDYGHGKKHSYDARDLLACENSEQNQQWV